MKIKTMLLTLSFAILLIGCSNSGVSQEDYDALNEKYENLKAEYESLQNQYEQEKTGIEDYKTAAEQFNKYANDSMLILANMSAHEYSLCKNTLSLGGSIDNERILKSTYEWLSKNSDESEDTLNSVHSDVQTAYKNLIECNISVPEADEINALINSIYSSYMSLYSMTMQPDAYLTNFSNDRNTAINDFMKDSDTLSLLCK